MNNRNNNYRKRIPALAPVFLVIAALAVSGYSERAALAADEANRVLLLKAGILTRLPPFIRWPDENSGRFRERFTYCIFGESALERPLRQVAAYADVKGGRPRVERISGLADLPGCHVVVVPRPAARHAADILSYTTDHHVLAIGDGRQFNDLGLPVALFLEEGKVRFAIDVPALKRSGLSASFRLLESAKEVRR